MDSRINKNQLFATLPVPWPVDLLPDISRHVTSSKRKVVVLDDDPTGTQTVHDVPVLTTWGIEELEREMGNPIDAVYLLTNTRAFVSAEAVRVNAEVADNLVAAATRTGRDFVVISRSDSTLRGHFPAEVEALSRALTRRHGAVSGEQNGLPPIIIVPFFEAGGRFTINDVHYVAEGEDLVPAAETPFAGDAVFGYRSSNLKQWVEEKTEGRVPACSVASVSIQDIRQGGPDVVRKRLLSLTQGQVCVVNACASRDLEVVALAALKAEDAGARFIYRTAAGFVAARLGMGSRPLWQPGLADRNQGGLIVVGSYVPKTTVQLHHLFENVSIEQVELSVAQLLGPERDETTSAAIKTTNSLLTRGRDVALFTSRNVVTGTDTSATLGIGSRISSALVAIVEALRVRPRFFIAKGGITSSDLATKALHVRRAMVLGQILPGVPVWELGSETRFPSLPYVVFPGNVGGVDALTETVLKFSTTAPP